MGNKMATTIILYGSFIGLMQNKMETTRVYGGDMGIMEKEMETTM